MANSTKVQDVKAKLADARARYLAVANTAPTAEVNAASEEVHKLQRALSGAITEGAKPCPHCEAMPHGIEQPIKGDRVEYEIGCLADHGEASIRVRGGILPRHAVEAWNELVDALAAG